MWFQVQRTLSIQGLTFLFSFAKLCVSAKWSTQKQTISPIPEPLLYLMTLQV